MMDSEIIDYFVPEQQIPIEVGTQMQIQIDGVAPLLKSPLIGIVPQRCLIIETPVAERFGTINYKLYKGNNIIIRYLHEGTVYGFQSALLGSISEPEKLIFVEYPKIVARHDLRSHRRLECFLPAQIKIKHQKSICIILDLSLGGCRCLIKALKGEALPRVEMGDQVILRCQLPLKGEQKISGLVRNVQKDSGSLVFGLQFFDTDPIVKDGIARFIKFKSKYLLS